MQICSLIVPESTLLEYSLFYAILYILLALLSGTTTFIILILRHKSKKVDDFRYNLSLSLTFSSIITCLSIPIITYFTQVHPNPFVALPHSYIFDVSLIYLYTLTIPIVFFLILSIVFFAWHSKRKKILIIEFNQRYAERKATSTK